MQRNLIVFETRNAAYIWAVRPAFYETRIWPQACARNASDTRKKTRSEYIRSRFAASLVKRVFRNAAQQPGPEGQQEDVRKILCGFCTCTRVGRKTVLYVLWMAGGEGRPGEGAWGLAGIRFIIVMSSLGPNIQKNETRQRRADKHAISKKHAATKKTRHAKHALIFTTKRGTQKPGRDT